uniref:Uncharacterized protein n=1 Tax=candidate division WOR-3 bacterium TaxID=2052148 RepID=A0A7C3Z237_UNCW3
MNVKFSVKKLCQKEGIGNFKLTPEEPIDINLDELQKKPGFETKRPIESVLIMKKGDVTWTISKKNSSILIENVKPDTPERALELLNEIFS